MRTKLMTIGVIYGVFFLLSTVFLPSPDPDHKKAILFIVPFLTMAGSIVLAILSYRYAVSIGRGGIIWALGAFFFPFIIPLILCFLSRPYGNSAISERETAFSDYEETPSEDMESLESSLSPSEIFFNSKDKTTYKKALKQIDDQDTLTGLLESVQEKEKIVLLLKKINNPSIIKKFAQEHSDNGVRISAIRQLRNQDLLSQIALHDTSNGVRMAAVANIIDTVVLEQISQNDSHPGVREIARKVLGKKKKVKKPVSSSDESNKKANHSQDDIQKVILEKGLRPFGNKQRLSPTEDSEGNAYLALFRDKDDAKRYYNLFIKETLKNPPPIVIEITLIYAPNTIFNEKYGVMYPYTGQGANPTYQKWATRIIQKCNHTLQQDNYYVSEYMSILSNVESVIKWDILIPKDLDIRSEKAVKLLCDPPNEGFDIIQIEQKESKTPAMPKPTGPWIVILLEIDAFQEWSQSVSGWNKTDLLLKEIGGGRIKECIVHGTQYSNDERFWCMAIHVSDAEQLMVIENAVKEDGNKCSALAGAKIIETSQIEPNHLPYNGYVDYSGNYIGN